MNDIIIKDNEKIEDMIYEIRGKQVMLDYDLARVYECTNGTKDINKAVKRNMERFPNDFYFQLDKNEFNNLKFQNGTSSWNNYGGIRKLPHVFTEQGVAMLTTVLRTKVASEMSVSIMRAFVRMRHYLSDNLIEQKYINSMVIEHDYDIKILQESLDKLEKDKEVNEVYFNGKIYDAYSKVLDIFSEANVELIIVDRYADKTILDMVRNLECKVILITGKRSKLTKLDIEKYNADYNNLSVYYDDTFHDRYIVIDRNKIYHSGNSINHIGYRKSSIDVINDKSMTRTLLKDIDIIIIK